MKKFIKELLICAVPLFITISVVCLLLSVFYLKTNDLLRGYVLMISSFLGEILAFAIVIKLDE